MARTYGEAMRLAIVATGRSAELFDRYKLNIVDGALRLSVKDADSAQKLSQLSGLPFYKA